MKCPHCGYEDSKVIDSRDVNETVRRRRECLGCGFRFTTHERIQTRSPGTKKTSAVRSSIERN